MLALHVLVVKSETFFMSTHYLFHFWLLNVYDNCLPLFTNRWGRLVCWYLGLFSHTCGGGTRVHSRNCTNSGNSKCCPRNAIVIETYGQDDCGKIISVFKGLLRSRVMYIDQCTTFYCFILIMCMHMYVLVAKERIGSGWSHWKEVASCSVTYGGGIWNLTRLCNNPVPAIGGRDCEGESF